MCIDAREGRGWRRARTTVTVTAGWVSSAYPGPARRYIVQVQVDHFKLTSRQAAALSVTPSLTLRGFLRVLRRDCPVSVIPAGPAIGSVAPRRQRLMRGGVSSPAWTISLRHQTGTGPGESYTHAHARARAHTHCIALTERPGPGAA
jgi:hypothetical protein